MQSRTESAISSAQMQLLLVGDNEDLRYLRELLNRPGDGFLALDHARSSEEANPDEPSVKRTIRYAIDVYCKERQSQKAEDTLRKLWRAVEQSADMVMITDRAGLIEYVNPAFEVLTGILPGGSDRAKP
jgi:PAS domain-containing protein